MIRLNGNLSLSRSIGDQYERANGLISEPEIFTFKICFDGLLEGKQLEKVEFDDPDLMQYVEISSQIQELHFVVQACDGLFEVFEADEVI